MYVTLELCGNPNLAMDTSDPESGNKCSVDFDIDELKPMWALDLFESRHV